MSRDCASPLQLTGSPTGVSPPRVRLPPSEDWFFVIACDGVFDVLSNEDVCTTLHDAFLKGKREKQCQHLMSASGSKSPMPASRPRSPMPGTAAAHGLPLLPLLGLGHRAGGASSPLLRGRTVSVPPGGPQAARNVLLHGNELNDVLARSACDVLRKALASQPNDDGLGMDNMSLIVARLTQTA
jgi:hypothetical protein